MPTLNFSFVPTSMVSAGNGAGVKTIALLTEMDNPIGKRIGHALEVQESIECLQGKGPLDLQVHVACFGGLPPQRGPSTRFSFFLFVC